MNKSKPGLKNVLSPSDSIAAVVVIIGIVIAIFIEQIEIKLIGVSISILGIVAFFMMISQRLKDYLDTTLFKKSPKPPDLTIVHSKDDNATRQVIENLEDTLDKDFNKVKKQENHKNKFAQAASSIGFNKSTDKNKTAKSAKVQDKFTTTFNEGSEGFTIVKKTDKAEKAIPRNEANNIHITNGTEPEVNQKIEANLSNSYIADDFSSMKIIRKDNSKSYNDEVKSSLSNKIEKEASIKLDIAVPPIAVDVKTGQKVDGNININKVSIPAAQSSINNLQDREQEQIQNEDIPQNKLCKKNKIDIPMSIFMDDSVTTEEPRSEFAGFVSRALMVIRSMASTTTAAFLLVNPEKQKLILETFVTDVPDAIIDIPKIPMRNDIISQITLSGKPEILTEINPSAELDLIPYYKKNVGSKSFIGMPIFYQNSVLGVLCADTKIDNAYDNSTVSFMGHFTKLIAGLIINYTEKYELKQATKVLDAICEIRTLISAGESSVKTIADAFIKSADEIFDYKSLGIVCFNFEDSKWKVFSHKNKLSNISLQNLDIELDRTMIGETIKRGITLNISINENSPTRVHNSEDRVEKGYFVAAPIIAMDKIYGAVYLEASSKSNVTSNDIKILESLGDQSAIALEQIHLDRIINTTSMIDAETGLINISAFEKRLSEELYKSVDFNIPVTLIAFKIDNYSSLNPEQYRDRYNRVVNKIIDHIRSRIKQYDVFTKADNEVFYLALIGMPAGEAQLWAERVRSELAQTVLNIDKKKFTVTISCGVVGNHKDDTFITLMDKADKALAIAGGKTNNVTVYG